MKKTLIIIILLISYNSKGQTVKKDTLYFKFKNTFLSTKKNYENAYYFFFKTEKLVTLASGNRVIEDNFFYFSGDNFSNLKPKKVCSLKRYLRKKRKVLTNTQSKKYDAYKLMQHFNKHIVYFLVDNKYIEVKAVPSLGE